MNVYLLGVHNLKPAQASPDSMGQPTEPVFTRWGSVERRNFVSHFKDIFVSPFDRKIIHRHNLSSCGAPCFSPPTKFKLFWNMFVPPIWNKKSWCFAVP